MRGIGGVPLREIQDALHRHAREVFGEVPDAPTGDLR
jgi:hypothetical protein